ncbi:hypothetical protein BC829DRAFT_393104 [Chytridium lagenaria]|nr:hypothetical protein BC829DRAFT_393104 [Chytridium lagenaria]
MDFDWYISPSDRFAHETEFTRVCKGEDQIVVSQLEPLFQVSRISQEDFLQIWWESYFAGSPSINQEQFVFFKHILDSRRKGRPLPVGVPLHIKESFLKDRQTLFKTSCLGTRDPHELATVEKSLRSAKQQQTDMDDKIKDLHQMREELQGLVQFKRGHLSALKDDLQILKEASAPGATAGTSGTLL